MITLQEAYEVLFSLTLDLKTQSQNIFQAQGSILAQDIFAKRDFPVFSNSAMDGYAVSEIADSYTITHTIYAGEAHQHILKQGECCKIMTGAMIPSNTLAIIPFENAHLQDNTITPTHPITPKQHIKFQGQEYRQNDPILARGTRLAYPELSLLASEGLHTINTYQKPKIAIYASGNELKEPWEEAQDHQIYNINATAYHSILSSFDFHSSYQGILPDCKTSLLQAIDDFRAFDIVLTSGGASVGEADYFEEALKLSGAEILFHGIRLKPGRPMLLARLHSTLIFSLPGNPLSGICNLLTLGIPALQKLSNAKHYVPQTIQAEITQDLTLKSKRSNMVFGMFDGRYFEVYQNGRYGSGDILPLLKCNAIAIFDESVSFVPKGTNLQILPTRYQFGTQESMQTNQV
ncbi:hypothetical protein BBW65_05975 [Helicobacter enhydrae]|uniref:Molybdopterin molybdenumtransferase n=1 Tax=Helicobacter enhydrae TaxID=222136 RepID=A0A1B1U6P7_9HELI|nr:molybdopterin molybdotransferase MoeA [Helicobacter enhydrae]ANV98372.1 hypothetical protein BBW65_05975 [Helicobacter enhydrae]